jgi:hypothetical protein
MRGLGLSTLIMGGKTLISGVNNRPDLTFSIAKTYLLLAGALRCGLLPDVDEPVAAHFRIGFEGAMRR